MTEEKKTFKVTNDIGRLANIKNIKSNVTSMNFKLKNQEKLSKKNIMLNCMKLNSAV